MTQQPHIKPLALVRIVTCIIIFFSSVCNAQSRSNLPVDTVKDYDKVLTELEKKASEKNTDSLGTLISTINFQVKTNTTTDNKEGFIPWVELEYPNKTIDHLIGKDDIVIKDNKVAVLLDYPLKNEYRFDLISAKGFTRKQLVYEISKAYHKIFKEEEATSTIKTIPIENRTVVYNRNQTNGKFGIWGHDLADLVLVDILVYKLANGDLLLVLNIES